MIHFVVGHKKIHSELRIYSVNYEDIDYFKEESDKSEEIEILFESEDQQDCIDFSINYAMKKTKEFMETSKYPPISLN